MTLSELLSGTGIDCPETLGQRTVRGVTNDSRNVTEDVLFLAVRGFRTDGHRFVDHALDEGALAAIVETPVDSDGGGTLLNPDGDNRSLLGVLSARFYGHPWEDLLTVGVTGTNGKTSTARMLAWILEGHGMGCGLLGTIGYVVAGKTMQARVTTPESHELTRLLDMMRRSGDDCCVMELSSHALALKRADQVRLDVAIFTNISQDHLDFHSDMGEYLRTKIHIFDLLKPSGRAVIGTYRPGSPSIEGAITFGVCESDDYTIDEIEVGPGRASYRMSWNGDSRRVELGISGRVNVFNSAGALATALELGLDPDEAVSSLAGFPGVPGRLEPIDEGQDFEVVVDYAHTPDALERALQQAREMTDNRVLVVFGAGGDRDRKKRPIMGRIASESAELAVVTSDNPRTEDPRGIIEEILRGMTGHAEKIVQPDRRKAIRLAVEKALPGDVVLIAGKGHEDYQVLGTERVHFDDREEARTALRSSAGGGE